MIKLEVMNTAFKGKRFTFKDGLTIGSGAGCTVRAQHDGLQDIHVRFYDGPNGHPMVELANEKGRLYVNGKDVMRCELRHNDLVTVGPLTLKIINASMVSSTSLRLDQLMADMEKNVAEEVHDFAREDLFYLITKDPVKRAALSFSIPSKDRFIEQAQVFLTRLVKQSNMVEEQVESFMTCAKELILNAHRHGHKYDESRKVVIRYRDLDDRIQLVIEDEGSGFDHKTVLDGVRSKDVASAARERYQAGGFGGLGFQLITRMAKELTYNDKGNAVTFSIVKQTAE